LVARRVTSIAVAASSATVWVGFEDGLMHGYNARDASLLSKAQAHHSRISAMGTFSAGVAVRPAFVIRPARWAD
jgi:hypothetical protein